MDGVKVLHFVDLFWLFIRGKKNGPATGSHLEGGHIWKVVAFGRWSLVAGVLAIRA